MMLTTLRLPGNVERLCSDLQTQLFREHGLVGARVLPPIVPLLWSAEAPALGGLEPAPLPPVTLGGLRSDAGGLQLEVTPAAPIRELARRLGAGPASPDREVPFEFTTAGVLLAPPPVAGLRDAGAAPAGVVVRSFLLQVIEVVVWEIGAPQRVVWREHASRRLRKLR